MKKIPTYRWMVCKGMQTVALTTTQREAEAEAARVGGEVHELMPQKNPPDPEYSKELGGGVWSKAYGTPDPIEEFYNFKGTPLSRTRTAVEALTAKQDKGWGGTTESVDGMKPLLFMTRKALLANKDRAAAKFIPALRPYRLDYTDPSHPEMIFKMPVYKIWVDAKESQKNDAAKQFWNVLEFGETGNGKMDKFALLLRRAMPKFDAKVRKEAEALERALLTMHQIAIDLPLKVYKGDFHYKNAAVDAKGNLILLDPLVAEMKWVDAEALWKKLRWPVGKQPKKPKAPKAPRAPKAAKAAKKATTKKPTAKPAEDWADRLVYHLHRSYPKAKVQLFQFPRKLEISQYADGSHWFGLIGEDVRGDMPWQARVTNRAGMIVFSETSDDFETLLLKFLSALEKAFIDDRAAKKATTKKPTAKKAGAFTAAGLPRLEAKPATKKPRAAKAAKAPKKLQGKKLDAFVSAVYSRVFDRVAVMWDQIGPIYKAIRVAYEQSADDEQGRHYAMEAAKQLRRYYGEK